MELRYSSGVVLVMSLALELRSSSGVVLVMFLSLELRYSYFLTSGVVCLTCSLFGAHNP